MSLRMRLRWEQFRSLIWAWRVYSDRLLGCVNGCGVGGQGVKRPISFFNAIVLVSLCFNILAIQ